MILNTLNGLNSKKFYLLILFLIAIFQSISAQNKVRNLNSEAWIFKNKSDVKWLPASIPGTVHTDLYSNKIIPDPFFGSNEKQLQWIENEDWEYQTAFSVSREEFKNENCILLFEGLDTYAEVFLNNTKILNADNMFRTWKLDVKNQLQLGQNTLRVVLFSSVKKGKEEAAKLNYVLPGDEKVFTRKAQYHYGWDWGPRFVTAGIWKNVELQFWSSATLSHVKYNQKLLTDDLAQLEFSSTIQSTANGKFQLKINDVIKDIQLQIGENNITIPYQIQNPKRWWSNGLGEAYLYPFLIELFQNKTVLAKLELNIGLRTIEFIQENDTAGRSFYFKLNGVPVFMKGANYIPPDSFLPRVTDSIYKEIVKNAVNSNMNMLRVWGGGVYADDAFYDECDKNGILVWQDFMFACAMYPGDEAFLENVKQEVIDNVSRLQNHPCIALWCGNNESDEGWQNWGWQKQYNYSAAQETTIWNDYKKLFLELIPQTLNSLLPTNENRYWQSSPSIGWGKKESLLQGDSHYWGVWWGMEPFEIYENKIGRFMSEYGFQGMPNLETFNSFAKEEDLNWSSEAVKNHQKHPTGYKTIAEYMMRDYKVPKSFEEYIYVSQLLQAAGMKTAIEAHRRSKPYCMGTLYWQLNDCWPVTSWSSVDYFRRWKASQYQIKKSYDALLISIKEEDENYKMYVINDDLKVYEGELNLEILDFKGKIILEMNDLVSIPSNSSLVYFEIAKNDLKYFSENKVVVSMSFKSESKKVKSLYYFVKPKDLQLTKPTIQIKKIDDYTIEITSDVLAKNVFLSANEETFFSDNYFDVLPNEKLQITLSEAVENIKVMSLFDTMQ